MSRRGWRMAGMIATFLTLTACAPERDAMQTIRDNLFYDGLAAFHEGFYKESAVRWERAAHFGDGEAARNLGHLYRQGLGVEQDTAIAVAWYQVAADAGVISAQYNLGMVYLKGGPNLTPNRPVALYWLNKAAASGLAPAQAELARIEAEPVTAQPVATKPLAVVEIAPVFAPPAPTSPAVIPAMIDPPVKASIQIGSYRSRKDAESDWQRLHRPGLEPEIIAVRLKDGKQWYRLVAQGLLDDVEAYCRNAQQHRITCWPGHPKSR